MSKTKVAIVTGSNKGLGLAIVKGLCEKFDGIVYLTSRDESRGELACKELQKLGFKPAYHQLDITDKESVMNFYNHIKIKHEQIDLLINNAGILFLKDAQESLLYQAEQTIFVNFISFVDFCEIMLPLVKDGGKIINISSSSGHLSRIPSEKIRNKLLALNLTLNELKEIMTDYLEAVKNSTDIIDGWGESSYVISKVGVNAYTFILQRRLLNRGWFIMVN